MPYIELTPKQRRTIETDIQTLFSVRGIMRIDSIEALMDLGPWYPWVETKTSSFPLSSAGITAINRLTSLYALLPEIKNLVTEKEINVAVLGNYSSWLKRELQPNGEEFTADVQTLLLSEIKEYEFWLESRASRWRIRMCCSWAHFAFSRAIAAY